MAFPMHCKFCTNICQDYKELFDVDGHLNKKLYDVMAKYIDFKPLTLNRVDVICLNCWGSLTRFHDMQNSLIRTPDERLETNEGFKKSMDEQDKTQITSEKLMPKEGKEVLTSEKLMFKVEEDNDYEVSPSEKCMLKEEDDDYDSSFSEDNDSSCNDDDEQLTEEYAEPIGTFTGETTCNSSAKLAVQFNAKVSQTRLANDDGSYVSSIGFFTDNEFSSPVAAFQNSTNRKPMVKLKRIKIEKIQEKALETINTSSIVNSKDVIYISSDDEDNDNPDKSSSNTEIEYEPNDDNSLHDDDDEQANMAALRLLNNPTKSHAVIKKWKSILECGICKTPYKNFRILQRHFRQAHPNKTPHIICCDEKLDSRAKITYHALIHLDPTVKNSKIEKKIAKSGRLFGKKTFDLVDEENIINKLKSSFICEICEQNHERFEQLREHFRQDHPKQITYIVCCERKQIGYVAIADHAHIHMNPCAFQCQQCGLYFEDSNQLRGHEKRHKRIKLCPICEKPFYNVGRHLRTNIHSRREVLSNASARKIFTRYTKAISV